MNNLDTLMNDINKKYDDKIVTKGLKYDKIQRIPFSSPRANYLTYGGIPRFKSTEFYGKEGSGKTTSALDIVKNAQKIAQDEYLEKMDSTSSRLDELEQKNNKTDQKEIKQLKEQLEELDERGFQKVVYVDAEHTLDEDWAKLNGVNVDDLILIQPMEQTCEQILDMIMDIIRTGDVILVVLDSIPMLVPQQIYEESLEKKMYGGIATTLTRFSSLVASLLHKYNTTLIGINQNRDSMDEYSPDSTPGGRGWKHLQGLRIEFRKGSFLNDAGDEIPLRQADTPAGNIVQMTIRKTKVSKPDRRLGSYTIRYDIGIDYVADTLDVAVFFKVIQKNGAWFFIPDENGEIKKDSVGEDIKFQGRTKMLKFLRENKEEFQWIYDKVCESASSVI